jgi:hypothetical protein
MLRFIAVACCTVFVIKNYSKCIRRLDELQDKISGKQLALVVHDRVCPGRFATSPLTVKPIRGDEAVNDSRRSRLFF